MKAGVSAPRAIGLLRANLRYVLIQGIPSPFIEMMGALTFIGLLWFGREEIKNHVARTGSVHELFWPRCCFFMSR